LKIFLLSAEPAASAQKFPRVAWTIGMQSVSAERFAPGPSESVRPRSCKTNVSDLKSAMDSAFASRKYLYFHGLIIPLIQPIDLIFQTIFNARQKNNELDHPMKNL
jgi:hypothetical protein